MTKLKLRLLAFALMLFAGSTTLRAQCVDILEYWSSKVTGGIPNLLIKNGNQAFSGMAQLFDGSDEVTVNGVYFQHDIYMAQPGAIAKMRITVYDYDVFVGAIGDILADDTTVISNTKVDQIINGQANLTMDTLTYWFKKPVKVKGKFYVAFEPVYTTDTLAIMTTNYITADGKGEDLLLIEFKGQKWAHGMKTQIQVPNGPAYVMDCDIAASLWVSYTPKIQTILDYVSPCSPSDAQIFVKRSPLFTSRMYSKLDSATRQQFDINFGDGAGFTTVSNDTLIHSYGTAGKHAVKVQQKIGWTNPNCLVQHVDTLETPMKAFKITRNGTTDFLTSNIGSHIKWFHNGHYLANLDNQVTIHADSLGTYTVVFADTVAGTPCNLTSEAYSFTTGLDEGLSKIGVEVYPNPASGKVHFSGVSGASVARVYSVTGQLLLEQRLQPSGTSATLDISSLPAGLYSLQLMQNGATGSQKLIVY